MVKASHFNYDMENLDEHNGRTSLVHNVTWGMGWGIAFGLGFSCYVVLLFLSRGEAAFEPHGMTLTQVVALYLAGGTLAGAVVGLLRPLTRNTWGAAVVGFLGAVTIAVFLIIAEGGLIPWTQAKTTKAIILGLVWGPLGGVMLRALFKRRD